MTYELITAEWDSRIEAATVAFMNGEATQEEVESVMADAAEAICAFLDGQA